MKFLIASDLHGSAYYVTQLIAAFEREQASKLLLLGDLLYHGPRNPFPENYTPTSVIDLLNAKKDQIICVRGNCDSEVDQMVLDFPIMSDYTTILTDNRTLFATHGHLWNENSPPHLNPGDVLLNGHTHIAVLRSKKDWYYVNPGSISLPKNDLPGTYLILENDIFLLKNLAGDVLQKMNLV